MRLQVGIRSGGRSDRPLARALASPMKIAFATQDLKRVDAHFGWAKNIAIYDVSPKGYAFLEAVQFDGDLQEGAEDKLAPKLEAISRMIHSVVRQAVGGEIHPTWAAQPDYPVAEALAVRSVLRTLLEHKEGLKIGAYQMSLMRQTIRTIDEIAERGMMTPAERTRIARTAQVILFTVF